MAMQKIGSIPDFTDEAPAGGESEQVSVQGTESPAEQPDAGEEKETPSEPPADEQPAEEAPETPRGDDTGALSGLRAELKREIEGLARDRRDLIFELNDIRTQRRETREAELRKIKEEVDELKDLHPDDVTVVERILKARGYVSQSQLDKMLYDARKQDEIAKFLGEFPEYGEEADPNRKRFESLLTEVRLYKEPEDPKSYGNILRRAHKALAGTQGTSERDLAIRRRQAEVAGVGAGGAQRSSSVKPFDKITHQRLLDGGWSEEDIQRMEEQQSQ